MASLSHELFEELHDDAVHQCHGVLPNAHFWLGLLHDSEDVGLERVGVANLHHRLLEGLPSTCFKGHGGVEVSRY